MSVFIAGEVYFLDQMTIPVYLSVNAFLLLVINEEHNGMGGPEGWCISFPGLP